MTNTFISCSFFHFFLLGGVCFWFGALVMTLAMLRRLINCRFIIILNAVGVIPLNCQRGGGVKALFWQTIAKANASERKFLGFCPLNTTLPARTERRCSAEKQLQDMFVVFIVLQKVPRPTTAAAALWMKTARLKTAVSTGEGIGFQRAPCTNPTEIRALNALAAKDVAPSAWRSPVDRRAVNGNRSKANAASFDVLTPATTRSLQLSVSGWCVMHLDFSPIFQIPKTSCCTLFSNNPNLSQPYECIYGFCNKAHVNYLGVHHCHMH